MIADKSDATNLALEILTHLNSPYIDKKSIHELIKITINICFFVTFIGKIILSF